MNRRTTAAGCLVASGVLHALSYFLWPANSEGTHAQQLAAAGAHSGQWAAATWVETIGWLLLVPALAVIWHEIRGRGRRTTGIGVWVSVMGVVGFFGAGVMNIVTIRLAHFSDQRAALALVEALHKDNGLFLFVVAPLMLGMIGFIVFLVGVVRAGWVGWWAPVAALVGVVASEALSASANPYLLTAAFAPMAVAWIAVARHIVEQPAATAQVTSRETSPAMA